MNKKVIRGTAVSSALLLSVTAGLTTSNLVFAVQEQPVEQTTTTSTTTSTTKEKRELKATFEYKESTSETGQNYESTKDGENIILAKDGSINFLKSTFTKTGDDDSGEADTLGFNAAILSINSSKIKISDSAISTDGKNANAVFAYGDSTIEVSDTRIQTESDNSSALMVVNGGTVVAENVMADTKGKDSPLIRFGEDGGEVTVIGGNYVSGTSDGVLLENDGSISVKKASFDLTKGDIFFVDGAEATIEVERSTFGYAGNTNAVKKGNNDKHNLLNVKSGNVSFTSRKNPLFGNIVADGKSEIVLNFLERTSFEGTINTNDKTKSVKVKLDLKSRIVLMGDCYISELENEVKDNSNIFANGHKLFVDGEEAKINQDLAETWDYDFSTESTEPVEEEIVKDKTELFVLLGAFSFAFMVALLSTIVIAKGHKREKQRRLEQKVVEKAGSNKMKKPWEKK